MKKLTVLCAAFLMAASTFAATVSYDLQGGVTNDEGYVTSTDMFWGFIQDYNTYAGSAVLDSTAMIPGNFYEVTYGKADIMLMFADPVVGSKWAWLKNYIVDQTAKARKLTAADAESHLSETPSASRGAIDNFFNNGKVNFGSWNGSFDGTNAGVATYAMYAKYWQHGFANRTEIPADTSIVLNEPFKNGFSFGGWYEDATFSGNAVIAVDASFDGKTLYAQWVTYIPNCQELWDKVPESGSVATPAAGVVSFVDGDNFYMEDAYAGVSCVQSAHGLVAGDKVVFDASLEGINGKPVLKSISNINKKAAGVIIASPTILIANAADNMFRLVKMNGVKVIASEAGSLSFSDGADTILFVNSAITAAAFPVGTKCDVELVVADGKLVGDLAKVKKSATAAVDPAVYANLIYTDDGGEAYTYSITNKWIISAEMGNWEANKPSAALEQCRGMVVKDGIVYFSYRPDNSGAENGQKLIRYDANTGERMEDIILKNYVFNQPATDTTGTRCHIDESTGISYLNDDYVWNYDEFNQGYVFGPNTDLQVDDAGNMLAANLPTEGHAYQIWKINPATGEGEVLVFMGGTSGVTDFAERFADDAAIRLDRFGVVGDVNSDAIIFAASSNSNIVYELDIVGGKWDGEGWHIICDNNEVEFGQTPRVFPVEDGAAFYVSGTGKYPEQFDTDGQLWESFDGVFSAEGEEINPACTELLYNIDGVAAAKVSGCNEFKCGGAYFFLMANATWETGRPQNSHLLFRFKNSNRHFYEMQRWTELPQAGFGLIDGVKNFQFNNVQCAEKIDDLNTAIYVYTEEYGFAKYVITADKLVPEESALAEVIANSKDDVKKVMMGGRMYIIRGGKAYTAMGQIAE